MSSTSLDERALQRLQAYHDGELTGFARWRVRRLLARSPEAQRELEGLAALGSLVREAVPETPSPDLWADIQLQLPRRAPAAAPTEPATSERVWRPWLGAGIAAAAAALVLAVGGEWGDAPGPAQASLRWLDGYGKPAMVLQDDREATLIWVIEGQDEASGRRDSALS